MIRITIELEGQQTETHCSKSSSIGACEMLNMQKDRCKYYKIKLEYDFDAHAYKRCKDCTTEI